jgi:3,4-dihydroxy 2-butanone 4-phosphate synthase/GTP cyclohydrolase II
MTHFDQVHHMAVVYGRIDGKNVPTRLHRANLIRDMFGGTNTVAKVLRHFKREGQGVIVFLRDGSVGVPASAIPKGGEKGGERNGDKNGELGSDAERQRQWREIGLGAQILKDLGITSIRLITSAKHRYVGLAGFGIEIVSTEPIGE